MITQERLKELFNYDLRTGIFIRRTNISQCKIGDIVGYLSKEGYLSARADGRLYQLAHLAWLYTYGEFPESVMKFKNDIKTDLSIDNLFVPRAEVEKDQFRICTLCGIEKEISKYSTRSDNERKRRTMCNDCSTIKTRDRSRTKKGVVRTIYNTQKQNSAIRGHSLPTYTEKDLRLWLYAQPEFHRLYDNWKRLDYQKDYKPSVDRKNDYVGYTMDNIQLMTWIENRDKAHRDMINGINTKSSKAVLQYDKEHNLIAEYFSMHEAERQTDCNIGGICNCCKGVFKTSGGFIWKYKDVS